MKSISLYIFGALIFVFAVTFTDAKYWGDSADYVDSVIFFEHGKNYNFWEFGHLLWRPLGWLVWTKIYHSTEGGFWRSEIASVFQYLSYFAGFASTLILVGILKKLKVSAWIIAVTVFSFIFSHAFINYTQTANSYISALMFYFLGLSFSLSETKENNFLYSILSGICLALTLCFWMPFLWAIPAVIVTPLVLHGFNQQKIFEAAGKIASFLLALTLFYGIALAVLQIDDLSKLRLWITAAAHGDETRGIMRMIFGFGRSFVEMGNDGLLFKRFMLKDPFNPVSFGELINGSICKLAAFYSLAAGVLFLLWQKSPNKKIFILLLTAALPVIAFASFSAGGEIEWYLAIFPFAFIGLAVALQVAEWKISRSAMLIILAIFALININAFSVWTIAKEQEKMVARINLLESKAKPKDTIFLVNWADDLINFNRSFPFHSINIAGNLRLNAIVTPGTAQTKQWREEFAARSLFAWEKEKNVWLSNRAFSARPKADWNWAEGDDKNVGWHEFPEFLSKLEIGEILGDENGFTLILPSETNKRLLQQYQEQLREPIEHYNF
ncbi:MAG: hypothetical protein ABI954_14290 [Pyrinomonadaceae bacterium]